MNRNHVLAGLLVVAVAAVGLGVAFYTGVGPAPGGSGSGDTLTEFPTETAADQDSDGSTVETPPFTFTIDATESCGTTCRDVTATLTNEQNETATGVTVYTRIFAGQNTTGADALVWEGKEDVGTLAAGGSHTTTRRVELSLQDARKIDQNDGWITIQTTVESDDRTVTFRDSEQVA